MQQDLLGIVYVVAFSHALMLSAALWRRSAPGQAGRLLAAIGMVISYKLFESAVLYTGVYPYVVHAMDLLPGEVLVIGPLIYLYTRRVTGKPVPGLRFRLMHLIPAAALWINNAPAVFRTADSKIAMWQFVLNAPSGGVLPWTIVALLLAIKLHLAIYLIASWRQLAPFAAISATLRADDSQTTLVRARATIGGFFALEALWVGLFLAQQIFGLGTLSMVGDIWLLFVALFTLALGFVGLQQPDLLFSQEERKLTEQLRQTQPENDNDTHTNIKYLHSALPETTGEMLAQEVEQQIQAQQLFLHEKLTLTDLARATGIKSHTLSQVINQVMKSNFYKLINGFRVQHAVALIEDTSIHWSLERIAYESGFHNRVSFSRSFKEIMGHTPSAHRKQVSQRQNA